MAISFEKIFFTALMVNTLQLILVIRIEGKLSGSVNFSEASSINHQKYFLSPFNDKFADALHGRKEDGVICSAAIAWLRSRKMRHRPDIIHPCRVLSVRAEDFFSVTRFRLLFQCESTTTQVCFLLWLCREVIYKHFAGTWDTLSSASLYISCTQC